MLSPGLDGVTFSNGQKDALGSGCEVRLAVWPPTASRGSTALETYPLEWGVGSGRVTMQPVGVSALITAWNANAAAPATS